ncbi:MAG: DndE family protein [Fusobacteriaceae bacterium]
MIFKLKTSKESEEIMNTIKRQLCVPNNIIARIAIALSIKKTKVTFEDMEIKIGNYDNLGFEFPRHVLFGENEIMYRFLIEHYLKRKISEQEFFPNYTKFHIEMGLNLLSLELKNARNLEKLVKQLVRGV